MSEYQRPPCWLYRGFRIIWIILHHIDTVKSGHDMLQKSYKDPCAMCLLDVNTKSSFCVAFSSSLHKGYSGKGEDWGGAILPLPWGLLIRIWRLWTRCHPHFPRISPITSRWRVLNLHASETWAPNSSICIACNATTGLWSAVCAVSPLNHRGPVTQYSGGSILCKNPIFFTMK